ncbi:hypothetical protein FXO38_06829 [Capsicum annuum]|uniref:Uncharacterized protein n=1 Tax=Capsicum annuum TaxID=4072 RepID=A0A2G2Y8P4_CAPAN|nr:hypothetical protein FXO37_08521 [Capsicum annuum]KAF3670935.1 hypothetical protein FXO38_06829 [Capsicum annuum]PHT66133.1 hypothetical protein T459_30558 [Capsicum annuum]
MFQVVGKLNRLKRVLQQLNKDRFSEIKLRTDEAKMKLLNIQQMIQHIHSSRMYEEERALAKVYEQMKEAENQYLRQKCKIRWLKEGDMNTTYFHSTLEARGNYNRILAVKDIHGIPRREVEEISKAFIEFHTELLGTTRTER